MNEPLSVLIETLCGPVPRSSIGRSDALRIVTESHVSWMKYTAAPGVPLIVLGTSSTWLATNSALGSSS